jgi:hypothetical protein
MFKRVSPSESCGPGDLSADRITCLRVIDFFTFSFRGIGSNNFTGELPEELGNLVKLEQM